MFARFEAHCTENPIYIGIPRNETARPVPNTYIHVSVSNLHIPKIGLPIWLQKNRQIHPGNTKIAQRYMNVEIGRQNIQILFWK
jgi:hypothetical protein